MTGTKRRQRRPLWVSLSIAVAMCLAQAEAASAALLFSGGEDIDFVCNGSGSCAVVAGGNAYRAVWAREAYTAIGTTVDPPTNRFATPSFSASATLWVHAQYCNIYGSNATCGLVGANNNTTLNAQAFRVFDSAGNPTLIVRGTGTAGQLKISSRTSGGTFTDLATCSSAFNVALTQLDLYVNYGTSGEVTLYSNSAQVCDYTGNVTNGDGSSTLDQVEFSSPYAASGFGGAWSEVIVATTDSRAMARFTANTVANGNTIGFSGTNVCSAIWNATTVNNANYGYSGSSSVLHECTINGSIPAGTYSVLGLVMTANVLVGTTGPQHFGFLTRTGGTDYSSANFAPTNSFSSVGNYIQTTNPATGNAWAVSDFAVTGFNVGEETQP